MLRGRGVGRERVEGRDEKRGDVGEKENKIRNETGEE